MYYESICIFLINVQTKLFVDQNRFQVYMIVRSFIAGDLVSDRHIHYSQVIHSGIERYKFIHSSMGLDHK